MEGAIQWEHNVGCLLRFCDCGQGVDEESHKQSKIQKHEPVLTLRQGTCPPRMPKVDLPPEAASAADSLLQEGVMDKRLPHSRRRLVCKTTADPPTEADGLQRAYAFRICELADCVFLTSGLSLERVLLISF
jgi:hypothetical protein